MKSITIETSNLIRVSGAPLDLWRAITLRLTFDNPAYLEAVRMDRWTGNVPEVLRVYRKDGDDLLIPRGIFPGLISLCREHGVLYRIRDRRRTLPEASFTFQGTMRPFQEKAVRDILRRDMGTLAAPTGSGKTVMALALVAHRRQPALIVVHTKELLEQWIDRIETFLGIPAAEIGRIGGGKKILGEKITVALVQSLYRCAADVAPHVGHLIVDECHRAPSRIFTEAVTAFDARYLLGLSATPWRRDRLSRLIFWHLGALAHEVDRAALLETGDVLPAEVIQRETAFETRLDPSTQYSEMLSELTEDPRRNRQIAQDVAQEARGGTGVCLVLSDRKAHCEALQGLLHGQGVEAVTLTGSVSNTERKQIVEDLNAGKVKALVATGQLIGEGFDCPGLTTLFLATPIKFDGRLLQYLGRVLRPAQGKDRARVFDYVDVNVGVLQAATRARLAVYERTGPVI